MLYANGHPEAHNYPFGRLWDEAALVMERINNMAATEAILLQQAVSSVLSKKAHKEFEKTLKKMTGDGFK